MFDGHSSQYVDQYRKLFIYYFYVPLIKFIEYSTSLYTENSESEFFFSTILNNLLCLYFYFIVGGCGYV